MCGGSRRRERLGRRGGRDTSGSTLGRFTSGSTLGRHLGPRPSPTGTRRPQDSETWERTKTEDRTRRSPLYCRFLDRDVTVTSTDVTVKSRHPSASVTCTDITWLHLLTLTPQGSSPKNFPLVVESTLHGDSRTCSPRIGQSRHKTDINIMLQEEEPKEP